MKLSNWKPCKDLNVDLDLTPDEERKLIKFAWDNISYKDIKAMLIQWSVIKLLKNYIEVKKKEKKMKPNKNQKKVKKVLRGK